MQCYALCGAELAYGMTGLWYSGRVLGYSVRVLGYSARVQWYDGAVLSCYMVLRYSGTKAWY
eukprot:1070303-Rhodomonas_salina.2